MKNLLTYHRTQLSEAYRIGGDLFGMLRQDLKLAVVIAVFAVCLLTVVFGGLVSLLAVGGMVAPVIRLGLWTGVKTCIVLKVSGFYWSN